MMVFAGVAVLSLVREPKNDGSLIFLRQGNAVVTGDYWRLLVDVNVTKMERSVKNLQQGIWQLQGQLSRVTARYPELRALDHELLRCADLASEADTEVDEFRSLLSGHRGRRGLVNAGGTLLKFLFGNPDADDVDEIRRDIMSVTKEQGEMVHRAQDHVTLTRVLAARIEQVSDRLLKNSEAVGRALKSLAVQRELQGINMTHQANLINQTITLTSSFRSLEVGTLEFLLKTQRIFRAVDEVIKGRFSRELVGPENLKKKYCMAPSRPYRLVYP